ncbi:hypothetical protein [Magnetofaba australis]|nr:hypothetical protein [Magnetofaba australis]
MAAPLLYDAIAKRGRWLGPTLLWLLGLGLAWYTWRKTGNPLIDVGRELYIPWRMQFGEWPIRDIFHEYGLLSDLLMAAAFKLFGATLQIFLLFNLTLIALFCWGLHRFTARLFDPFSAFLVTGAFLALFAFNAHLDGAMFNFASPYALEAPHGTVLALILAVLLWRMEHQPTPRLALGAGLTLGAVALTKLEIFAAAACMSVGFLLLMALMGRARILFGRVGAAFAVGVVAPPLLLFTGLLTIATPMEALRMTGGVFLQALNMDVTHVNRTFAESLFGLDAWRVNLLLMAGGTTLYGGLIWWARRIARKQRDPARRAGLWLVVLCLILSVGALWDELILRTLGSALMRALPLINAIAAVWLGYRLWREKDLRAPWASAALLLFLLACLAVPLMGRMLLAVGLQMYGFYLALPGFLLAVLLAAGLTPRLPAWSNAAPSWHRAFVLAFALPILLGPLQRSVEGYRLRTEPLAEGANRSYYFARSLTPVAPILNQTLHKARAYTTTEQTLAVLPEGVYLNFLAQRSNPTGLINLAADMRFFGGEERVLQAFADNPPDVIVHVTRRMWQYGKAAFGVEESFGKPLMTWVRAHYTLSDRIGDSPYANEGFGVHIWRLRSATGRPADESPPLILLPRATP